MFAFTPKTTGSHIADFKRTCVIVICFGLVLAIRGPVEAQSISLRELSQSHQEERLRELSSPLSSEQETVGQPENVPPLHTGMPLERVVLKSGQRRFERLLKSFSPELYLDDWEAGSRMKVDLRDKSLTVEAQQERPLLYTNLHAPDGGIRLRIRMRTTVASDCIFRWLTTTSPRRSDDKAARTHLIADGQWHEYDVQLPVLGAITGLAIEFSETSGLWELGNLNLWVNERYPLVVTSAASVGEAIEYTVTNKGDQSVTFQYGNRTYVLNIGEDIRLTVQPEIRDCFHVFGLLLQPEGYPEIEFSAFRYHPELECRWYVLPLGEYRLDIAEGGSMARIQYPDSNTPFVILAPLIHNGSKILYFTAETRMPLLKQSELNDVNKIAEAMKAAQTEGNMLVLRSEYGRMTLQTVGNDIRIEIDTPGTFEGPVVRAIGTMQGALLSGCEYLGPHDVSSSEIDVNELHANRFAPPTTWLTLPLMAMAVTNAEQFGEYEIPVDSVIALTWDDMNIQPTFDIVNQLDVVDDLRLSLQCADTVRATLHIGEGNLADAIEWYLKRNPLPEIPQAPRTPEKQNALTLQAFRGPLAGTDVIGWGFCAEPDWERLPYDTFASVMWRLSGQIPLVSDHYVAGGSAIPNETVYFLTKRALELVDLKDKRADLVIQEMRADGSFLFPTRFPDVEPTTPAAGYCARRTLELMAYVRLTGDRWVFQSVEKSIAFLEQFHIPRGGYFGEAPLHTPDLLSAAHMVILHVWAYEFSHNVRYLERARYWALMGVPFVYLRDGLPHMPYATVPMYGASERENPVWFGKSQPWCGCVYAYAIALLANYDKSIGWKKIARGILHHAESLQIEDGPYIGCIPDGFSLGTQEAFSWKVNPAVLASLRWLLDTSYDSYVVVRDLNIHVVSPFPARLTHDGIVIEGAPEGLEYQLMINGTQVIDVRSGEGRDFVPLK